ncbi:hypothetical protein B0H13DRAFT_2270805 [Mycena leptocephala]|nr:hypothetical protein B0H13DRAFT_2270805 [Mycena leptocephala]
MASPACVGLAWLSSRWQRIPASHAHRLRHAAGQNPVSRRRMLLPSVYTRSADFPTRTPGSVPPNPTDAQDAHGLHGHLPEIVFATGSGGSAAMAWSGEMGMNAPPRVPHAPQGLARERRARTGEGRLDLVRRHATADRNASVEEGRGARDHDELLLMERIPSRSPTIPASASFRAREFPAIASRAPFWLTVAPPTLHPSALYRLPGAGAIPRTFPASALGIGIGIGCEKQGHGWECRASGQGPRALRIAGDGAMRAVRMRGERSSDLEEREGGAGAEDGV